MLETMKVKIEGMTCGHCQARVQKALDLIPGISANVDLESGLATIKGAMLPAVEIVKKAVEEAGYEVKEIS